MHVTTTEHALLQVDCDLLAIGVHADQLDHDLTVVGELGPSLAGAAREDEFTGKAGSAVTYAPFGQAAARRIALVGLGKGDAEGVRQGAGKAGLLARNRGAEQVVLALGSLDPDGAVTALEAFAAGNYRFDRYKPEHERKAPVASVALHGVPPSVLDAATPRFQALAAARALTRDLVNEPAGTLYPEALAEAAKALADACLQVEVWDENRIREAGMGGITAVGQGSSRPARFVHMTYKPSGTPRKKLALVGKGVTFDAGGLSLKPTSGMQTMRSDMAGAGTVIGVMRAIRDLQPDVEVHGIFGAVENMNSANSYKLGDILRIYNGKTVEIHNTDAEGRLVLADCLSYASKLGVDALVDLATLTGACVVALGEHYTGLFTPDDDLADELLEHAAQAGDGLWRMPLPDFYKEKLKAEWGGIKNVGSREAGAIIAALFLSEFVENTRWAHCDIAGPAFIDSARQHFVPGATGAMVPTLVRWVLA